MKSLTYNTQAFWYELGMEFLNHGRRESSFKHRRESHMRRFKQSFGCTPTVLLKCWCLLSRFTELDGNVSPNHLLWAVHFLKDYGKESKNAALAGCDEKTFRKWTWVLIYAMSDLEPHVVSLFSIFAFSRISTS